MADILRMVLSEFWPFVAAVVLIGAVGDAIAGIVKAFSKVVAAFRKRDEQ